ncbi:ABC-three component system protein [Massilia psychrophila]|uniref:ABC-three component systems C-terminal domain-containing protein n=1 Tax=Massilia psychrophila TaxID=1603353 RepID=A0A2G8T1J2_9BURK|nr:ABC-three component system protein [Massilia psychrophila]PIL39925.1 hypothetical protein CR103_10570 [Massilia psychrophila]
MTPLEIVNAAVVHGTRSVFVLGCFEKRVTVYSQQIRALNLVDGILSEGLVRAKGKVAIVGGGVAGMTAAVALAKAAPELQQLDLFESRARVLELQHGSSRFLHPHFYDWPDSISKNADAGLPIMNWQAGPAGAIADTLRGEFERATHSSVLRTYPGVPVIELKPNSLGLVRVVAGDGSAINRIYDAVILAIGFGIERGLDGETPPYWTPSGLAGSIITPLANPIIFISGNGDGGLVDFQMAAFNALEHRQICELLASLDLGPARTVLEAIEQEAWADGANVDLFQEYQTRVRSQVPTAAWAEISERLRPNVRIWLHTNEPRLFRRTTALHNRFATFLAIEAHREIDSNTITLRTGVNFAGPLPSVGEVTLEGEAPFHPLRRYLRIGPDAHSNLSPFSGLLAGFVSAEAIPSRPESPILTATARARFDAFKDTAQPDVAMESTALPSHPARPTLTVSISLSVSGRIVWAGDVSLNNIIQLWAGGSSITVHCDINAANASMLMPAIARIGVHAQDFVLYARDFAGWQAGMLGLCSDRFLPGADLNFCCLIKGWLPPPPGLQVHSEQPIDEVVRTVHDQLDADLLQRLHDSIFGILGPAEIATGWPIEPALRQALWELWIQWHAELTANPAMRQRFLRLLASVNDQIDAGDGGLVQLGPKVMRPYLVKPTLFGLAFAACSDRAMGPAGRHPGNIAFEEVTGHACGVGWINRRELRGRAAAGQSWTTNVVLLSQLQEAVQLLEGDQRLDQNLTDQARIGLISLADKPIVIGANEDFLMALQSGIPTVQHFFQAIFERRAIASQQSLEEA